MWRPCSWEIFICENWEHLGRSSAHSVPSICFIRTEPHECNSAPQLGFLLQFLTPTPGRKRTPDQAWDPEAAHWQGLSRPSARCPPHSTHHGAGRRGRPGAAPNSEPCSPGPAGPAQERKTLAANRLLSFCRKNNEKDRKLRTGSG